MDNQHTHISPETVAEAVRRGIITGEQSEAILQLALEQSSEQAFNQNSIQAEETPLPVAAFTKNITGLTVTYYFGGLLTIIALIWFGSEAFKQYNTLGLFIVSITYFAGFFTAGHIMYNKKGLAIPGGLLLTATVPLIALIVFCIQDFSGVWKGTAPGVHFIWYEWIKNGWFVMETVSVALTLFLLYKYDFPFLTVPLIFAFGFLTIDLAALLFGNMAALTSHWREIWLFLAALLLLCGYFLDKKPGKDFAFWFYFFGSINLLPGLHFRYNAGDLYQFAVFLISLGFIVLSVPFRRRVFLVYGVVGSYIYIIYLAEKVFRDSLFFPLFLTILGLGIIALGVAYTRNKDKVNSFVMGIFPPGLSRFLPPEH